MRLQKIFRIGQILKKLPFTSFSFNSHIWNARQYKVIVQVKFSIYLKFMKISIYFEHFFLLHM